MAEATTSALKRAWRQWRYLRGFMPWHAAQHLLLTDRPVMWLYDNLPSSAEPVIDALDEASEWVRRNWPWCKHVVVNDHCGRLAHRHCDFCQRPFAGFDLGPVPSVRSEQ